MNPLRLRVSASLLCGLAVFVSDLWAGEPAAPVASPAASPLPAPTVAPRLSEPATTTPAHPPVTLVSALTNPLFMAEYVSTHTEHGIAGFTPGRSVRLVRVDDDTGRFTISDGKFQIEVAPTQLTDDPKLAAALQRQTDSEDQTTKQMREAAQLAQHQAEQKILAARQKAQAAGYKLPPLHFGYTALGAGMNEPSAPWEHLLGIKYQLRGDPYTPEHTIVPRMGPNTRPAANPLDQNRNYLGFY